jgi:hypothetical protein
MGIGPEEKKDRKLAMLKWYHVDKQKQQTLLQKKMYMPLPSIQPP